MALQKLAVVDQQLSPISASSSSDETANTRSTQRNPRTVQHSRVAAFGICRGYRDVESQATIRLMRR